MAHEFKPSSHQHHADFYTEQSVSNVL